MNNKKEKTKVETKTNNDKKNESKVSSKTQEVSMKTEGEVSSIKRVFDKESMKSFFSGTKEFMGKLSRGLMLPIAVLPIAGLFLGIGGAITGHPDIVEGTSAYTFGLFLKMPGDVVFGNLPVLFAVSIAIAFSRDKGAAGLSALLGWAVFNGIQAALISPAGIDANGNPIFETLYYTAVPESVVTNNIGIRSLETSVFGGIIVGFIVSYIYNKYNEIQLPTVVGFFSGTRFVLIATFLAMFPVAIITLMIWPGIGIGLEEFGKALGDAPGGINSFVFGFFERILVPFGLHHAFYSPLWYTSVGGSMSGAAAIDAGVILHSTQSATAFLDWYKDLGLITDAQHLALIVDINDIVGENVLVGHAWLNPGSMWDASAFTRAFNEWQAGGSVYDAYSVIRAGFVSVTGDQQIWMNVYGMSGSNDVISVINNANPGANLSATYTFKDAKNMFTGVNPGQYMQGKFSFMIFGLPAAGAAMIMAAPSWNRKAASAIIISAAFTSFLTGITEPIEFTFLFLAPWLFFGPHALMCALSFMLMNLFGANMGMTFSGGAIDYVIYGIVPDALGKEVSCYWPIVLGIAYVPIYYFGFLYAIRRFDISTPGRGTNIGADAKLYTKADVKARDAKKGSAAQKASNVLKALGGKENIKDVDACITKLRVTIKDKTKVDEKSLKDLGAKGVIWISKDHVHALFGTEADPLKTQINKLL